MQKKELIDSYLLWFSHNKGRADATVRKYRLYLDKLFDWSDKKGIQITDLTSANIEEFTGIWAHKEGLSPSSRRPLVAAVKGFFSFHAKSGKLNDIASDIVYPIAGSPLAIPLQLKSAEKLLMQTDISTFKGCRDAAILSVLIGCGTRVSGLCNLNQSDLIFSKMDGKEWLVLKVREKGKKERLVPTPQETRLYLLAYLGSRELKSIDRRLPGGDQVLFVSFGNRSIPEHEYRGEARRISPRSVNDMIERYGEHAGIPRNELHSHAARHLYGTELTEENVHILRIQGLMGHADPKTTEGYTKLAMRSLVKEIDRANPLSKIKTHMTGLRIPEKSTI